MAKRFVPMKEFGRTMKKPKLDVSIARSTSISDVPSSSKTGPKPPSAFVHTTQKDALQSVADLWDDDENDVLLFATQVVESEIAAAQSKQRETPMEITESEITFSEFDKKIQQHSTQAAPSTREDLFSPMFDDDDDDIISLAAEIEKDVGKLGSGTSGSDEAIFKKPEKPCSTRTNYYDDEKPSTSKKASTSEQHPAKSLMERLKLLEEENAKLNKELCDVKETVQTKTGEASLLRNELRHTKQKLDEIKIEKMFQSESATAECKSKIEELAKTVKNKDAELQLKSMECSVLKMRQADESRRLETTVHDITIPAETGNKREQKDADDNGLQFKLKMCEFEISEPAPTIESMSTVLTKQAFEPSNVKCWSRKWQTTIQEELLLMQRLLAKIKLNPDDLTTEMSNQILESVRKVLLAYYEYTQELDFGFNITVLPQHDYNILADTTTRDPGCLHCNNELYPGEKSIYIRRYIAILAVFCEKYEDITFLLLNALHDEKPLLSIASNAIYELGFSLDICLHFGALEAFAVLLRSMLIHLKCEDDEEKNLPFLQIITGIFKQVVFARPNPWTLLELSYSMLEISNSFSYIFSLFCYNSAANTFILDRAQAVYRFTNDSCLMQVYCGLVEAAFPLYVPLTVPIFELQTELCLNHVRFVYSCLTEQPDFVDQMLPSDEEDEENEEKTGQKSNVASYETSRDEQPSTSKNITATSTKEISRDIAKNDVQCQCFEQLCLTAIRMVWLSLRQWLRLEKMIETDYVAQICGVAMHIIYFLVCDNYLSCLFRDDEDLTKHFLYQICDWCIENQQELQFSEIQANLLQKIKKSHVIPKLFCEEDKKLENISADLAQWCRLTNDDEVDLNDIDPERTIKNLKLEENIWDPERFFDLLKEQPINMEAYDFS